MSERERQAAVSALLAGSMKVSLVDWTSFEIMRAEGMREAFAFDEDFRKQGFMTVP